MPTQLGCHEHLANTLPMRRRANSARLRLASRHGPDAFRLLACWGRAPSRGEKAGEEPTAELPSQSESGATR
jgi:hypothetical protein